MPKVDGKMFPYTAKGMKDAMKAREAMGKKPMAGKVKPVKGQKKK